MDRYIGSIRLDLAQSVRKARVYRGLGGRYSNYLKSVYRRLRPGGVGVFDVRKEVFIAAVVFWGRLRRILRATVAFSHGSGRWGEGESVVR